ncbi:hypothetical protein ACOME3_005449 [Neoechinorhynchus agilis]
MESFVILSGSDDQTIKQWNVRTLTQINVAQTEGSVMHLDWYFKSNVDSPYQLKGLPFKKCEKQQISSNSRFISLKGANVDDLLDLFNDKDDPVFVEDDNSEVSMNDDGRDV